MSVAIERYTGTGGADYHSRRASGRSAAEQQVRAVYFEGVSTSSDTVLDFGCATGGILSALPAAKRIGVEVSEVSSAEAHKVLDRVVSHLDEIEDASIDVAISFHALEHVPNPQAVLLGLRRVLRPSGRLRLIVPYDNTFLNREHREWAASDPDQHLFTWTPMALGNLLSVSGFKVEQARCSHWARPGKLGRLIGAEQARWFKAIRAGRLQVIADATCA
ncbi:class I SAM-dependent methyltransferase [Brevundimonas sp.]|uniref:class I SAM-dependent methyltransferase n=1 Tax=Brevundimonas sp. TaxID=1871086 RepID=UPI003D0FC7F8